MPRRSSLGENLRFGRIQLLRNSTASSRWSGHEAGTSIALYSSSPRSGEHNLFSLPNSFAFCPSISPLIQGEYSGTIRSSTLWVAHASWSASLSNSEPPSTMKASGAVNVVQMLLNALQVVAADAAVLSLSAHTCCE